MALNHNNDSSPSPRLLIAIGVAVAVLSAVLPWVALNGQEGDARPSPEYSPFPTATSGHARTSKSEITSRLQRILQIREAAYRHKNPEWLREIYSEDCPCLERDERAINELLERDHKWVGIETSMDVRSVKQASSRVWIVVAEFSSGILRIETEDGKLVDMEPAGSDLLEFTLVKPLDSHQWLLGFVTASESVR
jgi:hypothetical protein